MASPSLDGHGGRPTLLEVAGVAGAGKSTLARAICEGDPRCRRAEFIRTRTPGHVREVVLALPRTIPVLVDSLARPRLSWPEFKLLAYVTRWQRLLERRPSYRDRVAVLDQGPLYALVRLRTQKPELWTRPRARRWWAGLLEGWLSAFDGLVGLVAPDEVRWGRINDRSQSHATKGLSFEEAVAFLGRYRALFADILDRAEAAGRPLVLRFDTSVTSPTEIALLIEPLVADARTTAGGVRDAG